MIKKKCAFILKKKTKNKQTKGRNVAQRDT